jgi:hypothetical protein
MKEFFNGVAFPQKKNSYLLVIFTRQRLMVFFASICLCLHQWSSPYKSNIPDISPSMVLCQATLYSHQFIQDTHKYLKKNKSNTWWLEGTELISHPSSGG